MPFVEVWGFGGSTAQKHRYFHDHPDLVQENLDNPERRVRLYRQIDDAFATIDFHKTEAAVLYDDSNDLAKFFNFIIMGSDREREQTGYICIRNINSISAPIILDPYEKSDGFYGGIYRAYHDFRKDIEKGGWESYWKKVEFRPIPGLVESDRRTVGLDVLIHCVESASSMHKTRADPSLIDHMWK
ncbi:MAG: hypothetical protein KJ709_03840 [Nanoarchaeota archaeon]|nr:hypothetical protein [Nanoarchaeota archaeon]